jgi:hypothetical protein
MEAVKRLLSDDPGLVKEAVPGAFDSGRAWRAGRTILPLHRAVRSHETKCPCYLDKNLEVVREILNGLDRLLPAKDKTDTLNAKTMFGFTAFMLACESGDKNIVQLLLEAGCDTTATNDRGHTGLVIASHAGHGDLIRDCLRAFAEGSTPDVLRRMTTACEQLTEYENSPKIENKSRCVARSEQCPQCRIELASLL